MRQYFTVLRRRCASELRRVPQDHDNDAYSRHTASLLSYHRAQHIQRVEGMHPRGHDVTTVQLRDEINRTYLLTHSLHGANSFLRS